MVGATPCTPSLSSVAALGTRPPRGMSFMLRMHTAVSGCLVTHRAYKIVRQHPKIHTRRHFRLPTHTQTTAITCLLRPHTRRTPPAHQKPHTTSKVPTTTTLRKVREQVYIQCEASQRDMVHRRNCCSWARVDLQRRYECPRVAVRGLCTVQCLVIGERLVGLFLNIRDEGMQHSTLSLKRPPRVHPRWRFRRPTMEFTSPV